MSQEKHSGIGYRRLTAQRLVAIFLLGGVVFNWPLLSIFNRSADVLGVPVLYLYLFGAWLALIVAMAAVIEGKGD